MSVDVEDAKTSWDGEELAAFIFLELKWWNWTLSAASFFQLV